MPILADLLFVVILAADWNNGTFPDDFEKNLLTHYRDYLDENKNVIPGREKNLEAFIYFVSRILPSVNWDLNQFTAPVRKSRRLSQVFNVSDEAYALVGMENDIWPWIRKRMAAESRKAERMGIQASTDGDDVPPHRRPDDWFRARWSGSHDGNKCTGWDAEGINRYSKHAKAIVELRAKRTTGTMLEDYLRSYWLGTLQEKGKKQGKRQEVVEAWSAPDDLDTKYAEV